MHNILIEDYSPNTIFDSGVSFKMKQGRYSWFLEAVGGWGVGVGGSFLLCLVNNKSTASLPPPPPPPPPTHTHTHTHTLAHCFVS